MRKQRQVAGLILALGATAAGSAVASAAVQSVGQCQACHGSAAE